MQQAKQWVEKAASEGLEPPTLGSEDRCSNPLSYEANIVYNIMHRILGIGNNPGFNVVMRRAIPVKKRGLEYGF